MTKRSILHMFNPMPNNSPFDINMALDSHFDLLMPYNNVRLDDIRTLTQDVIFSRSPSGIRRTHIFVGGRDIKLAVDMMDSAKQAMFPPFEVSVFADPSGAFTTAAALVACVEKKLAEKHHKTLKECKAVVLGGTGPVGIATGVIASLAGSDTTLVDYKSEHTAHHTAKAYNDRYNSKLSGIMARTDAQKIAVLQDVDIIFCAAKAGMQVISADVLRQAKQLKVAGDVNAVAPSGIAGIDANDHDTPLPHLQNAFGIGALAIGHIKYQTQHQLFARMLATDKPIYLDFREAFTVAQQLL